MFNINNYIIHLILIFYIKFIEPYLIFFARLRAKQKVELPLISIIIPTYNRGDILVSRTIPSILKQTYQNFELLIIGDNCIDDTENVIKSQYNNINNIFFVNLKQKGNYPKDVANKWFVAGCVPGNKGLSLSKGDWIVWFDDDDVMVPDYIESLLSFAQNGNHEFVAGLYEEHRYGKKEIKGYRTDACPEFGGHSTWMYKSYLKYFKYNINSWRKKWNKPADIDLQLRMMNSGVNMASFEKVVSYVIPRPGLETIGLEAHYLKDIKVN